MLRNYLKITYRQLLKNKVFSLTNILGLAIGMSVCLLIIQYVSFELSYDTFHERADQIYRVAADYRADATSQTTLIPPPLGPVLYDNYSEVINFTRMILPWSGQAASSTLSWQASDDQPIKQSFQWGFFVDPGFLEIFSFDLIQGNSQEALKGTHKIILSASTARKLFGNNWQSQTDIIGQTVEYINDFDRFTLVVSGIIEDAPPNAHFQYDFLASFATLSTGWAKDYAETWGGNSVYTYLQLSPETSISEFDAKISEAASANAPQDFQQDINFSLQHLTDIHLYSHREEELGINGKAWHIYFFSILAVLILLIALINYVNLVLAKMVSRSEEMGIRKVMGAKRSQLISQLFFESLLYNGIALGLALTAVQIFQPLYSEFTGQVFNTTEHQFWAITITLFVLSTLVAGLLPTIKLTRAEPTPLLRGNTSSLSGRKMSRGLVVSQFGASIVLIVFTFAILQQLNYMRTQDLGFSQEGILVIKGSENRTITWIEHDQQKSTNKQEDTFKNAILPYTGIEAVSFSRTTPGEKSSIYPIHLGEAYNYSTIDVLKADSDYATVYDLELLAGRFNTDQGQVVSKSTAKLLGYDNPSDAVGKSFRDKRNNEHTITGVVQDYYHQSLQHEPRPFLFSQDDLTYKQSSYYSIKIALTNLYATLEQIKSAYQTVFPYDTFEFYFVDDYFDAQYREDIRFGQLFGLFSGLTIFIACLGLFGLSLHTVLEKTKEIGIRKVLGASVQSIVTLLSWNFVKLVLLASALALPIAYWIIQRWLENYASKIEITGWLLLLPIGIVLLIAVLTISFQTIRAALANPTDSLRYE
ncbi:MAG: ABC transporter permease [Bacteroidota bacterium]